ncbi:MAG TPA: sugar phosphate isomerase/epimerase family protein [Chitinophagaceae bacterium]|jgi:inosose dehydratase|nr:sugar phosphate isomerase/epimerase family protein [Chitinophagaceae bacterium]
MSSRRNFIQKSVLGISNVALLPLFGNAATTETPANENVLQVGMAGYTFAKFDVEKSVEMMKRVDVKNLSVKDFHLPLDSTPEKIQTVMAQFVAGDIKVYAVGVIYMKTKEAVDQAFDYAKKVGVSLIVGVPNPELIDYAEEKVKISNIRLAIHNHGPEDKLYPSPKNVYDLIKNRDERVGLCIDIGHSTRAGQDPAKAVLDYNKRVFDLHIKDVTAAVQDGKAIEVGRGVIDFPALVKALNKIKYKGMCSLEFEKDMSDSLPGIAESAGFFKGVIKTVG